MKALVFNYLGSAIDHAYESISLRLGYLLTDHTVSAGTSGFEIAFEEFNPPKLEQKLQMINSYEASHGEERQFQIEEVKRVEKALNKIKHLDKQGIVVKKKFEKAVDVLFNLTKADMLEEKKKKGLPQLLPLCDGPTLGFYATHYGKPEEDNPKAGYYALSKILNLQFPEEDKHEGQGLFILPSLFLLYQGHLKREIYQSNQRQAADSANIYLEKCLSFPNINILSAVELKSIREYLQPLCLPFRQAIDEWMKICYGSLVAGDTMAWFREKVRVSAAPLAALIKQNEVLQHYDRLFDYKAITNLWIGEVPVRYIWQYYRDYRAIPDETWEALMKIKDEQQLENKRWPVLVFEMPGEKEAIEQVQKEKITVASAKKSLAMD